MSHKNRPASRSVFLVNGCVVTKKNGHPCYNFVCTQKNNKNDHVLISTQIRDSLGREIRVDVANPNDLRLC